MLRLSWNFNGNDPYDILSIHVKNILKSHSRSLRGHKGVKGQIFKNAPIELKFINNDQYDILSICNIDFEKSFEVIKGSQRGQKAMFIIMVQLSWKLLRSNF